MRTLVVALGASLLGGVIGAVAGSTFGAGAARHEVAPVEDRAPDDAETGEAASEDADDLAPRVDRLEAEVAILKARLASRDAHADAEGGSADAALDGEGAFADQRKRERDAEDLEFVLGQRQLGAEVMPRVVRGIAERAGLDDETREKVFAVLAEYQAARLDRIEPWRRSAPEERERDLPEVEAALAELEEQTRAKLREIVDEELAEDLLDVGAGFSRLQRRAQAPGGAPPPARDGSP